MVKTTPCLICGEKVHKKLLAHKDCVPTQKYIRRGIRWVAYTGRGESFFRSEGI